LAGYRTKIKVDRIALLEAVRNRKEIEEKEHNKKIENFNKAKENLIKDGLKAIEKVKTKLENGEFPKTTSSYRSSTGTYTINIVVPTLIAEDKFYDPGEYNSSKIDRLIKTLEIAAEDSIAISADDAALYLG